jgi:nucleotide-binding universal stress UspA family protein
MDRFTNILVVIDDTRERPVALDRAIALARRHGARGTAVHAFDGGGHGVLASLGGVTARDVQRIEPVAGSQRRSPR